MPGNPQQIIEKPFIVYESSAGSGKTFTLVREYLNIVLQHPLKYQNILAITFTNKAANEMKERIIRYLKELSSPALYPDSISIKYLLPELVAETGLSEQQLTSRSGSVLELILHNYSNFAIGTIDSFIHRIVRTFAYDLHLPLNFEVELESEWLISEAVDLLIDKLGSDKKLTRTLVSFVVSRLEDEKSWNIEYDLKKFALTLLDEEGQLYLARIRNLSLDDFEEINKSLKQYIADFKKSVASYAGEALNLIQNENLDQGCFYQGSNSICKWFHRLADGDMAAIQPNSYVITTINEDKWTSGKATFSDKAAIDRIKGELINYYNQISKKAEAKYGTFVIYNLIYKNIYSLALLNEIEKIIEDIKQQNNIVHISEFNRRIVEIVLNEPVPFIYERLGERYKHFLIDEFQDTSVLQWQNLLPLVDNSLAEGRENLNILVGDAKQAIYRWRNGEVEQLVNLPRLTLKTMVPVLEERENTLIRNFDKKQLKDNYRSKAEIVEFNNTFFTSIKEVIPDSYKRIYENPVQQYDKENTGGLVRLRIFKKKHKAEFEQDNLEYIHILVNELLQEGFQLSDIAILCRSNDEGSMTARFLLQHGIRVISSESLLLGSSPVLSFIVAVIRYLNDPAEKIHHAMILSWFHHTGEIGNHEFSSLLNKKTKVANGDKGKTIDHEFSLVSTLKERGYNFNPAYLRKLGVYDLCEEIIRSFGLNETPDPFLEFFLNAVQEMNVKQNPGLVEFVEWWDEQKEKLSISTSEGIAAVRIMTIHKSKGLEFPVVIFPYADHQVKPGKKNLWIELEDNIIEKLNTAIVASTSQLEKTAYGALYQTEMQKSFIDLLNMLYVVMTRPRQRLYVLTAESNRKGGDLKSLPHFFEYFLNKQEKTLDEQGIIEFGVKSEISNIQNEEHAGTTLRMLISEEWHKKVLLSLQAPRVWDHEERGKGMEWGSLVHTILSMINTKVDIDYALDKYLTQGDITEDESIMLRKRINELINHPLLNKYFSDGITVRREAGIMDTSGHIYRPDRFVVIDGRATIIDYKTGRPEREHHEQINQYATILERMGYSNIEKILVYIGDEISVEKG